MTPFQASRRSLAYQFTVNVPLTCPHFQLLEKICIFSLILGQNVSSQNAIFQNIRSQDPLFFQGKSSPKTQLLETRAAHTHQKKGCAPPAFYSISKTITSFIKVEAL